MSSAVITVENLGKRYRIGVARKRAQNLREALKRLPLAPFRYLQTRLRGATDEEILWALKDVSFEVKQGEVLGVIGRNGAGKSTLLKILSRITDPTEGHALIRGRVNSLLEVGTGFHGELTGRENIFMNAAMHGMKRREIVAKMDEIIAFAEVEKFIDTPVKFYSSGMYVRLAFAVAANLEPDILIVDEVLAVGDVSFQRKCMGKMGEVGREGRTVLIVSHNMPSIMNLCGRVLLLRDGCVAADGPADRIVQQHIESLGMGGGQMEWSDVDDAPGDRVARIRSVRVLQGDAPEATSEVLISEDVAIAVEYEVLEDGARLYAALHLKTSTDVFVLATQNQASVSLNPDEWYSKQHPRGLYRSVCTIPGNFLNEGGYTVTGIIGAVPCNTIAMSPPISFTVHDTGEMRKEYYGSWAGPVVRPRLDWRTVRRV